MYNQDVIDRLNNLTNLYALKNANVKIISKKNEFGDMVKFFAQINTENIIQRITYKATGCTTFMALCSYFCEIVEGKTIDKALKINEKDLEKFSTLEESKTHVYKIILDTFALLIKKYNVGIKKGKIISCEPLKEIEVPKAKTTKKTNKIDEKKVISDIQSKYAYSTQSTSKKEKNNKDTSNIDKPIKSTTKKEKSKKVLTTTSEENIVNSSTEEIKQEKDLDRLETIQRQKKALEQAKILAKSAEIAKIQSEKENKSSANSMKLSHLNALNDKIKNKETNEKMKNNSDSLNNLLSKFNSTKTTIKTVVVEENTTETIKTKESTDNKENINDSKKIALNEKSEKKQKKEKDTKEKDLKPQTEKKKGLFSWFRK